MNLDKYESAVFNYGTLDCCLFVCDVIKDHTGIDYAARWRGTYKTELGAFRLVRDAGGFQPLMCQAFGNMRPVWSVKELSPVLLSPEAVEHDSVGYGLGVWDGSNVVALSECGLMRLPLLAGRGCWNI